MDNEIVILQMWVTRQEFWVGFALPAIAAVIFMTSKKVRAEFDKSVFINTAIVALLMLAIHVFGWTYNYITYTDFVNAHLIALPLFWSASIQKRTHNPISSAITIWAVLMTLDLICALGFGIKHQTTFYLTAIGSGGSNGYEGFGDGLFIFPIVTALVIAAINWVRVENAKQNFGITGITTAGNQLT